MNMNTFLKLDKLFSLLGAALTVLLMHAPVAAQDLLQTVHAESAAEHYHAAAHVADSTDSTDETDHAAVHAPHATDAAGHDHAAAHAAHGTESTEHDHVAAQVHQDGETD